MVYADVEKMVEESPIPLTENLMYIMAESLYIMMQDLENDMKMIEFLFKGGVVCKVNKSATRNFADYVLYIKRAKICFEKTFDKDMSRCLHWRDKDNLREESNELIRLIMYYIDRCAKNRNNTDKIFEFIKSLESGNVIPEDYINRFHLG